jgi:hypothetical protein
MVEVEESTGRIHKLNSEQTSKDEKKRSVSRWSCKNKCRTNSLWNLPDVLGIGDIKEVTLGGLLLQSTLYFRIL